MLKKRDEERARSKEQLKLERMTPEQLAQAESRAAETKAVGLDCEMVGVGPEGSRDCLAKVAICNEKGEPLYIRHVIPTEQVVDYRGHITGLRAEHLTAQGGAVTFEQAQARVSQMVRIPALRPSSLHLPTMLFPDLPCASTFDGKTTLCACFIEHSSVNSSARAQPLDPTNVRKGLISC